LGVISPVAMLATMTAAPITSALSLSTCDNEQKLQMPPFELSLESDLNVEWQRFANEWLFKWHGMTYEGGVTDVDDFRGGRIHYGGIRFGGQQQQIYWQAIDRYLNQKIHSTYKDWDERTPSISD